MRRAVFLVLVFGVGLFPELAHSQPNCANSTFPPRLSGSPKNNVPTLPPSQVHTYTATLIDAVGAPVTGWSPMWIRINMTGCASAPAPFVFPDAASAANGTITWARQLTFGADPCRVAVEVDTSAGRGTWVG